MLLYLLVLAAGKALFGLGAPISKFFAPAKRRCQPGNRGGFAGICCDTGGAGAGIRWHTTALWAGAALVKPLFHRAWRGKS